MEGRWKSVTLKEVPPCGKSWGREQKFPSALFTHSSYLGYSSCSRALWLYDCIFPVNSFLAQCARICFYCSHPQKLCALPIVAVTTVINGVACRKTQIYYVIGTLFLSVCVCVPLVLVYFSFLYLPSSGIETCLTRLFMWCWGYSPAPCVTVLKA